MNIPKVSSSLKATVNRRSLLALMSAAVLASCAQFKVDYTPLSAGVSRNWTVASVDVVIPKRLTEGGPYELRPVEDLVWFGDGQGNMRDQIAAIFKSSVTSAAASLHGPQKVDFRVTVLRFNAITPYTYDNAPAGTGVNSVRYTIDVFDHKTRKLIASSSELYADSPAAVRADTATNTANPNHWIESKARISGLITAVTRAWIGYPEDIKSTFYSWGT